MRLVSTNGRTSGLSSGLLQIFINNEWGTVCDRSFSSTFRKTEADVACNQLGFPESNAYYRASQMGYGLRQQCIFPLVHIDDHLYLLFDPLPFLFFFSSFLLSPPPPPLLYLPLFPSSRLSPVSSSVQIWLRDVSCTSSTPFNNLRQCSHSGTGVDVESCSHSEDIILSCRGGQYH